MSKSVRKDMFFEGNYDAERKEPCDRCMYRETPLNGPYCGKCIHAEMIKDE